MVINFIETKLVTQKEQIGGVLISALGLSIPYFMIASGAEFFVFFYYFPTVRTMLQFSLSPDIADREHVRLEKVYSNSGFLRSTKKQIEKHGYKFQNFMNVRLMELERSYSYD